MFYQVARAPKGELRVISYGGRDGASQAVTASDADICSDDAGNRQWTHARAERAVRGARNHSVSTATCNTNVKSAFVETRSSPSSSTRRSRKRTRDARLAARGLQQRGAVSAALAAFEVGG